MKTIQYVIKDELGFHARPAGLFVKEAAAFAGTVKLAANGREVDAKRLLGVMSLGAKKGCEIVVTVEGDGEEEAAKRLETFLQNNL